MKNRTIIKVVSGPSPRLEPSTSACHWCDKPHTGTFSKIANVFVQYDGTIELVWMEFCSRCTSIIKAEFRKHKKKFAKKAKK